MNKSVGHFSNQYLVWSGIAAVVGAFIHLAALIAGPAWYGFIGAPNSIVHLAEIGHPYPVVVCIAISSVLLVWAAYAFSGAGIIPRLPLVRVALVLISSALIVRGLAFIPLMAWRPSLFTGICSCNGIDTFLVITSAICLATGLAFAVGTYKAWTGLSSSSDQRLPSRGLR